MPAMLRRLLARAGLLGCSLAIAATTASLAANPGGIPTYRQCSKSACSATARSAVTGRNLVLQVLRARCSAIQRGLRAATLGPAQPDRRTGRFSTHNDIQTQSSRDHHYYVVHVAVTGTVRFKKSITATVTATSKAPECPAASQRPATFKLKYTGLTHGG